MLFGGAVLRIKLLGRPCAFLDGQRVDGPRGRKSWALLGILLLAERPPDRASVARMLFPGARDPLGALRWALSQLRRGLMGQLSVSGDPLVLELGPQCRVDVLDLLEMPSTASDEPTLLETADGLAGPDFEVWLVDSRNRIEAVLGLATVQTHGAATRAAMVASSVATGNYTAALVQLSDWSTAIRHEHAASRGPDSRRRPAERRGDVVAEIEAGQSAVVAGAARVGMKLLRNAVRLAKQSRDEQLQARALFAFGSLWVHAVAAHAPEGGMALWEACRLARRTGDSGLAADALRELAFVANCGGDVVRTRRLLAAARTAAGDNRRARSGVRAIEGMYSAHRGMHDRALRLLRESAELADSVGQPRQAAWSMTNVSWSYLQRGDLDAAYSYAALGAQMAFEQRWTAILPWIDSIFADIDLAAGRVAAAEARLRKAWALSSTLDDPCLQSLTARGLGLVAFAGDNVIDALHWLDVAVQKACLERDRNVSAQIWAQEALCRVTVAAQLPRAAVDVAELAKQASATHQPDLAIRAELHRAELGKASVPTAARSIAANLDSPAPIMLTG